MLRPSTITGFLLLWMLLWACGSAEPRDEETLDAWAKESQFAFDGIVLATEEVAKPGIPLPERAVAVRVEAVYEKPAGVRLHVSDVVWVQPKAGTSLGAGDRATFYASGWIYAESLLVREVGHETEGKDRQVRSTDVGERRQKARDSLLRERMQTADAVVIGVVLSTEAAKVEDGGFESEHNPVWQDAIVEVDTGLKGARQGEKITVRFAASRDVAWFRAPKLEPNQRAVFLLRKDRDTKVFLLSDPRDLLAPEESGRAKRLMGIGE